MNLLEFKPLKALTSLLPKMQVGICSQKELKHFWNRVLLTKHSDNTLQLLGEAISYEFMSEQTPERLPNIP